MKNKKELGQHWLKNRAILDEIAGLAAESAVGLCVEIGPGLGTLTSSLLKRFPRVIAVEYDADLAAKLPGQFPGKNLEVVNADVLQYDFDALKEPYTVVGNIPYYITSPIIEKVLTLKQPPARVVLLMQKEVAERIASERGSVLALAVWNRAEVKLGPVVKAAEFTPPPKVDSQVIIMVPHAPVVGEAVMRLVKLGFVAPRKKLVNNLEQVWPREVLVRAFDGLGISRDARPSDLALAEWDKLYQELHK